MAGRRGPGYKRQDGLWVVPLELPPGPDGKRRRKTFAAATLRAAQEKARQWEGEQKRLAALPPAKPAGTVAAYLDTWLNYKTSTIGLSTAKRYRELVKHITDGLGDVPLVKLTPAHLRERYSALVAAGMSAATVQRVHTVLHGALRQAVLDDVVVRNVTDAVRAPRAEDREMATFTLEQVQRLFVAIRVDEHEALYLLLVTTGLRLGEALALRWSDVDLDRQLVTVSRTVNWLPKQGFIEGAPKSSKGRRQVALMSFVADALRRRRAASQSTLIFCTATGDYMDAANIRSRHWYPLLERAGLPRIRLHDLRHTFASLLLGQGESVKLAQTMLGHAQANITLNTYGHVMPGAQEAAVARLEALFHVAATVAATVGNSTVAE